MSEIILLDKNEMLALLNSAAKKNIHDIHIENTVESTNTALLSTLKNKPYQNTVLLAEEQTAGRGRLGRPWISPAHQHIYLSLSWYFQKPISALTELSLCIAQCIVTALKHYGITEKIDIKHPNDLLHDHKKFCGILIETVNITQNLTAAVIGIGLNVNAGTENNAIDQPWTSLQQITQRPHDRNALVAAILNEIITVLSLA